MSEIWLTCVSVSIIRARALKDAKNLKQPVRTKINVIINQKKHSIDSSAFFIPHQMSRGVQHTEKCGQFRGETAPADPCIGSLKLKCSCMDEIR